MRRALAKLDLGLLILLQQLTLDSLNGKLASLVDYKFEQGLAPLHDSTECIYTYYWPSFHPKIDVQSTLLL